MRPPDRRDAETVDKIFLPSEKIDVEKWDVKSGEKPLAKKYRPE